MGIAPGRDGALAVVSGFGSVIKLVPFDVETYRNVIRRAGCYSVKCCLENVSVTPEQDAASAFGLGEGFGFIQGLLAANEIPYEVVAPQEWKKEFQITGGKNSSVAVCGRLFSGTNLRRGEQEKEDHGGMAEALLMAEYARRTVLGAAGALLTT